jgi:hypothetical protein
MAILLSRDEILQADDLKGQEVYVAEWGGTVLLRELRGRERDAFEEGSLDKKRNITMRNMRARLVALSVVDGEGERLFTEKDAEELGNKSATALNKLFETACRLSGITEADIDELEGNLGKTHNDEPGLI